MSGLHTTNGDSLSENNRANGMTPNGQETRGYVTPNALDTEAQAHAEPRSLLETKFEHVLNMLVKMQSRMENLESLYSGNRDSHNPPGFVASAAVDMDDGTGKACVLPKEEHDMDEDEKKHDSACRRAEQIMRSCNKFNGINTDGYIKWRFNTTTLIENSFVRKESWTRYYCLLFAIEGTLLAWARSVPRTNSASDSFSALWSALDNRFLTTQTVSNFEKEFASIEQFQNESVESFTNRFLQLVDMRSAVFGFKLSDLELKSKYSNALKHPGLIWIKAVADGTTTDFDSFMRTMISFDKNLPRNAVPITQLMAMGGLDHQKSKGHNRNSNSSGDHMDKSVCYRCSQSGHYAEKCQSDIIYNQSKRCQKCGTTKHGTSACRTPNLQCKRCQKQGHVSGVCRASCETADLHIVNNCTVSIVEMEDPVYCSSANIPNLLTNVVDNDPLVEMIKIVNGQKSCMIPDCLKDTGASASFMHHNVAKLLIDNGLVTNVWDTAMKVQYANKHIEQIDMGVTVDAEISCQPHSIHFLVTKNCSPRVILGRPILKQLIAPLAEAPSVCNINCLAITTVPSVKDEKLDRLTTSPTPWIEDKEDHLVARLPLIECANVFPYREKERRMSVTDSRICYERLIHMSRDGKVTLVPTEECHVTLAPRLVDKQQGTQRILNDPKLHSRYRITLDCRPINEMRLVNDTTGTSFMLVPPDQMEKTAAKQSQFGARELLNTFPLGDTNTWYAKIDLSDAYSSVHIPRSLSRLFCTSIIAPNGSSVCFQWNCLPQGWKHSPFLFSLSVNMLLRKCDDQLTLIGVTSRHYQDDILLTSNDEQSLQQGMNLVIKMLQQYEFIIRMDKCVAPTTTLTYCGFELYAGHITPAPKTPIEKQLLNHELEKFHGGTLEHQQNWVRQWAGRIQYFRDFIVSADMVRSLNYFYLFLKLGSPDEELAHQVSTNFVTLVDCVLNPLPLSFGIAPTIKCVLLIDANCESWGAILLRCVHSDPSHSPQSDTDSDSVDPKSDDLLQRSIADLRLLMEASGVEEPFGFLPIKLLGGVFSERQQHHSSTHRERLAQLEAFEECYSYLDAPLIIVCDNKNCSLEWHNLDLFGSRHLDIWEKMQAKLDDHGHKWLGRQSAPAIADSIARMLTTTVNLNAATIQSGSADQNDTRDISQQTDSHSAGEADEDIAGLSQILTLDSEFRRELIRAQRSHLELITKYPNRYKLIDGILVYVSSYGNRCFVPNFMTTRLLLTPIHCRAGLLQIYHDKLSHCGVSRLLSHVTRNWYWPSMANDCINYVSSCVACQLVLKSRFPSGDGELRSVTLGAKTPFEMLMIDYAVFQGSNLLMVIDCYSHWLFTAVVPDQTAATTAIELRKIFMFTGFPSTIVSDNGSHFVNELISELSNLFQFRLWTGSSYHPQRQGLIERAVGEIKLALKKSLSDTTDLNSKVALATFAHNISHFRFAPNLSPYILLYGRDPRWLISTEGNSLIERDALREVWEHCRLKNLENMNDNSVNDKRRPLEDGDQVIWTYGNNKFLKMIKSKIGNMYELTDGRLVPAEQIQFLAQRFEHLQQTVQTDLATKVKTGDLILFLRDDCMDLGRVVNLNYPYVQVVNLYMDEDNSWWEHGDQYVDNILINQVIKIVKLTRSRKIDQRFI